MKSFALLVIVAGLTVIGALFAQEQGFTTAKMPTVDTKWPGVNFAICRLERIQDNRLLVFVRVIATSKAPAAGIFLGTELETSPFATMDDSGAVAYDAKPFSLASAVMIDDQTLQRYSVLPPVAPPGKRYFPGELGNGLLPGQAETLTIQFQAPPARPPVEGRQPARQTVSFLLPGANAPIANLPVPPAGVTDS
jgi:hypothetical protein